MKRHVALVVETSSGYGRDLMTGIVRYMRMHDEWSVFLEQRDLWKKPPSWLADWHGDGIISRATTPKLAQALHDNGVPLVEVTDRRGDGNLPQVRSDDEAIGRIGAEHLLERGFRRFAFCGFRGEAWSLRRERSFVEQLEDSGHTCSVYNSTWHGRAAREWEIEQQHVMSWLGELEPPFAVMSCNDVRGQHVIDACSKMQLSVPEQVAVLGVDNDDLLCRVCSPPLSSVIPNAAAVGFSAAEMLSQMMRGETPEPQLRLIPPIGVATRQSTDVVAMEDREVAAALRYIREHACRGVSVEEVVRNSTISRSTLERQVRKYLGRTPQEEIRRVQIKRAQELMLTTDLSAEQIAVLCGFDYPEYFYTVFKRVSGVTSTQFRKQTIFQ
ncbi:DNA-binding transcriptional regulator [Rhodopirellula sp. JC740]|uniref:DNA-binding transcriptional regulator n=1 Tax=Rhodopirellula halodulae TaxID=2894198 RepID=A0ABS8NE43_9BACT|nr:DNA-binding transcriptional regulator [Rhodopirellula sp. JC740]MCC9641808.1 DNA-binding transcriptional regulator [Rhodopirellula sp. JC740]